MADGERTEDSIVIAVRNLVETWVSVAEAPSFTEAAPPLPPYDHPQMRNPAHSQCRPTYQGLPRSTSRGAYRGASLQGVLEEGRERRYFDGCLAVSNVAPDAPLSYLRLRLCPSTLSRALLRAPLALPQPSLALRPCLSQACHTRSGGTHKYCQKMCAAFGGS